MCHRDLRTQFPKFTNAAAGAQIVGARPGTQPGRGGIRAGPSLLAPMAFGAEADAPVGPSEEGWCCDLPPAPSCLLLKERPGQQGCVLLGTTRQGRINGEAKAGVGVGWGGQGVPVVG